MNTRPSRSFLAHSQSSFCIHNTPKRGGGPYSSGCRSFFIDAGQSSGKNGVFMRFERERKNGRRVRKKKRGWQRKENAPWGLNSPHSNGCWVFIYSGRGQSTFDYSTVTSRNPLQLLGQLRF